jgi:two-component system chemotaxis response regulator CheY
VKVLVIDDEPDIRSLVSMILESAGHMVVEARDGAEGLSKLQSEEPDVVLLDLRMPVIDGWEFMRRAREGDLLKGTRIIGVSAHASPDSVQEAAKAGCHGYVSKPFTMDDLLSEIDKQANDSAS